MKIDALHALSSIYAAFTRPFKGMKGHLNTKKGMKGHERASYMPSIKTIYHKALRRKGMKGHLFS